MGELSDGTEDCHDSDRGKPVEQLLCRRGVSFDYYILELEASGRVAAELETLL